MRMSRILQSAIYLGKPPKPPKRQRRLRTSVLANALSRLQYSKRERKREQSTKLSEIEFNLLADQWEQETRNVSSPRAITKHPAVQTIVQLGEDAVPMILRRIIDLVRGSGLKS